MPVLAAGVALLEAEDVLDVKETRGVVAGHALREEPDGRDRRVRAEDDALAGPAVPVEEGIDAVEHLGGERAGGREEVEVLDGGRAHFFVAPAEADVAEGELGAAEAFHIGGKDVSHAVGAHRFRHELSVMAQRVAGRA